MQSHEKTPQYNPLQGQEFAYLDQPPASIADELYGNPYAEHLTGSSMHLSYAEGTIIAENAHPEVKVEQRLLGYIGAGDESFSVIEAKTIDKANPIILLARIDPSGNFRPTIYSVLEKGIPLEIGRLQDQNLGDRTSRNHFRITSSEEGLIIDDLNSKNGTCVLSGEPLTQSNELSDLNTWSVKSSEVKSTIEQVEIPEISNVQFGFKGYEQKYAFEKYKDLTHGLEASEATKLKSIIFEGLIDGKKIDLIESAQRDANEVVNGRIQFAKLYVQNPQEAALLAVDQVAGFHGTRSAALAGILEQGYMGSGRHLREQEAFVFSGEHMFQSAKGQGSISFSNISGLKDGALKYAGSATTRHSLEELDNTIKDYQKWLEDSRAMGPSPMLDTQNAILDEKRRSFKYIVENPNSLESELTLNNFPVVVTISRDGIERSEKSEENWPDGRINRGGMVLGSGDLSEFQLMADKVMKEEIPLILVPENEVGNVRELCKKYGFINTRVSDIESYQEAVVR